MVWAEAAARAHPTALSGAGVPLGIAPGLLGSMNSSGRPIVQDPNEAAPGYYVSTTAFQQPGVSPRTPQAQLDSKEIPFIVIPSSWSRASCRGVRLGDFAVAYRLFNGKHSLAVVGDLGPCNKLGEGSVTL